MIHKKTALVLPPVFHPLTPPLSLAYLKGFLIKHGVSADTFDLNNFFFNRVDKNTQTEWLKSSNTFFEKQILNIISSDNKFEDTLERLTTYDIIAFSCYKSNLQTVKQFAFILKSRKPELKIVLGGPEITSQYLRNDFPGELQEFSDFLIAGEGELPLLKYISGQSSSNTAIFDEIKNLKALGDPDFSDFNLNNYPKKNSLPLMFSRGCVRKCEFCSEKLLYKKFRTAPVENIISQISRLKNNGIEYFVFYDSLINGDLKAFENLLDEIIKNFGSINWEAQIAVRNDMKDGLFDKIKKSGCYNLFVGLESGSDNTLKKMNKGFTQKEALEFFKQLNSHKLNFGISLIVGFPGESEADFNESLDFVLKNKNLIKKIEQINPFVYYDGTFSGRKPDYKTDKTLLERTDRFVEAVKKAGIKHTNAYVKNLVEPQWKQNTFSPREY